VSSACFTASCTTTRLSWERWMAVAVETTSRVSRLTTSASRPRTPRRRMLGAVGLELVVQRLQADAEHVGGAGLVVAVGREGLEDQGLLGVLQARADPEGDAIGPVRRLGHPQGGLRRDVLGQDRVALADDDGPLERVAQLADVAVPRLREEPAQHSLVQRAD